MRFNLKIKNQFTKFVSFTTEAISNLFKFRNPKRCFSSIREIAHKKLFSNLEVIQRSNVVTLPVTKSELSQLFGVQRQSLFRELKKMSDEDLISIDNRKITVF